MSEVVRALWHLLEIGGVLALCGAGPFAWASSARWRHPWIAAPLLLCLGMALISLVAVNQIYFDGSTYWTAPLAISLSLVSAAAWLALGGRARVKGLPSSLRSKAAHSKATVLFISAGILSVWPSIRSGGEQAYRIGVDQIGYSVTAQYLVDGGTRTKLSREVLRETGKPELKDALLANMTSLNFDVGVAAELILKSQRYGYSGMLAGVARFLSLQSIVSVQMLFLFFPVWLLSAVVGVILCEQLGCRTSVALAWAVAAALNCNFLNVMWEGQHAQIYSMAFTAVLFRQWWLWRNESDAFLPRLSASEIALAILCVATVTATYFEQIIALGVVWLLLTLADLVVGPRRIRGGNLIVVVACLGGFALTGGYMLDWAHLFFRHTANVARGGGGFWQPKWALPIDILGYLDMYTPNDVIFLGRPTGQAIALALVSIAIVDLAVLLAWRKKGVDRLFWIVPMVFPALIFAKSLYQDGMINYNYMKAYTFFLVPFLCLHAWSLDQAMTACRARLGSAYALLINGLFFPLWIAAVGAHYIERYDNSSLVMPKGLRAFAAASRTPRLRDAAYLLNGPKVTNMMLGSYLPLRWLNPIWSDTYLPPFEGAPIYFLALKRDVSDPRFLEHVMRDRVVYSNDDVLVLDTGERVHAPKEQLTGHGLDPVDTTNPDKPDWPVAMKPTWDLLVAHISTPPSSP